MARLATTLSTFCGHSHIVFSWIEHIEKNVFVRHCGRIDFPGIVTEIDARAFMQAEAHHVFRVLDGYSYNDELKCYPCVAILSPSEFISWKRPPVIRYAPSIKVEDLGVLSGLSTRYGLVDDNPNAVGFPASEYGSIKSRMLIVGGNFRVLFRNFTLDDLKQTFNYALKEFRLNANVGQYFHEFGHTEMPLCYRLFACFSVTPFDEPGDILFVSPWIENKVKKLVFRSDA
jgi:hypothetical protein